MLSIFPCELNIYGVTHNSIPCQTSMRPRCLIQMRRVMVNTNSEMASNNFDFQDLNVEGF